MKSRIKAISGILGWLLMLSGGAVEIVDGSYVSIRDGHLVYNGEPLKLWGMNFCSTIKRGGKDLELTFDRLAFMKFNAIRTNFTAGMTRPGEADDSVSIFDATRGDGSQLDRLDYAIYLARQRGMFFWLEFNQYRNFKPRDYDLAGPVDDRVSREEWNEMITQLGITDLVYLSRRGEELLRRYAANLMNHVNPYTGKRYAQEETIALYQLFNENAFPATIVSQEFSGALGKLIQRRWNEFLQTRYGNDDALRRAWGALADGESLVTESVQYGPLPATRKVAAAGYQYTYVGGAAAQQDAIIARRQEDVMRFAYWIYTGFNRRFTDFLRTLAPPGVGINRVPITSTCRYADDVMMYAAADTVSDFTALGTYSFAMRPWEVAEDDHFYPWVLRLNNPPAIENPIDLFRTAGKPYLIYEVNDYRPNPYRVEFPVRVALNSLLRGGDGVFWFNWDDNGYLPELATDADYVRYPLPMSGSYPNAALIMCNDETMLAAVRAAGELFLHSKLEAFQNPVKVTVGKDLLMDIRNRNLSGELRAALYPAAWLRGVEVNYSFTEPSRLPEPETWKGTRLELSGGLTFDWSDRRGFIKVDRPNAKLFVGFVRPEVEFDRVRFRNFNRDYLLAALIADDGLPLPESKKITLTLVCRSANTGLRYDPAKFRKPWADGLAEAIIDSGSAPVRVERVAVEIAAPDLAGRTIRKYDFTRKCYAEEVLPAKWSISDSEPLFFAEITP